MKLGIMQPYFFPYIGYFQLIKAVDNFVVYDNIKYTKKGWINRNRYLLNGSDADFTVSLKKDSDSLDVAERQISPDFDKKGLLNKIREAYRKAPYFNFTFGLFEHLLMNNETNLFNYIHNSISTICKTLNINTNIIISSTINIDHSLKAQDKVIAICKELGAKRYINAIGGQELYSRDVFIANNIQLSFIQSRSVIYRQFNQEFVPWLSILDVLMFNDTGTVEQFLDAYDLI